MDLSATFIAPFEAPFMQRAAMVLLLLAIPAGLLGAWVVTRRLAFLTHAVGQSTFPALVIAALAGWSLTGAAIVAAVAVGLMLAALDRVPALSRGVAVAVVLSTSLAVGAILVSDVSDPGISANGLLFGSVLAVTDTDLTVCAAVAIATLGAALVAHRPLVAGTFHRDLALAGGARAVRVADVALIVALSVAAAVSVRLVGSLLVAGLFLIPSATARLLTARVVPLMIAGGVLAAADGVAGLWLAWQLDAPPGATIASLATAVFVLVAVAQAAGRRRQVGIIPT